MGDGDAPGRILVFSIAGCGYCKRAKALLREEGLAFAEVNLDVFPERRDEAMARSGMSTLPQVYFNARLVGGYSELRAVFDAPEERALLLALLQEAPGADAPPPADVAAAGAVEEALQLREDPLAGLVRRMREGKGGLSVGDRFYHLRKYPKCFVGQEAVRWMREKEGMSWEEAMATGKRLLEKHFFNHVCLEHGFEDKYLFYRFIDTHYHKAFNMASLSFNEPLSAPEVAEKLRKLILAIYDEFLSDDGKSVDYAGIGRSPLYRRYVAMSQELQRVDLFQLTREEKLALFINLCASLPLSTLLPLALSPLSVLSLSFR